MNLPNRITANTANGLYSQLLSHLLAQPRSRVAPRGLALRSEVIGLQLELRMPEMSVISIRERKLNYHFMVAEALWLMLGRDDVTMLDHYCGEVKRFSDDGDKFYGAYGPRIGQQLAYVIANLKKDAASRQAVLMTWRPNPPATKDVPCTLSMQFLLRQNGLNLLVGMRSSDAWLGIPYDLFNFSLILNAIAGELQCGIGSLIMTLGSSHLYDQNTEAASFVSSKHVSTSSPRIEVPRLPGWCPGSLYEWEEEARLDGHVALDAGSPWDQFLQVLAHKRELDGVKRWLPSANFMGPVLT